MQGLLIGFVGSLLALLSQSVFGAAPQIPVHAVGDFPAPMSVTFEYHAAGPTGGDEQPILYLAVEGIEPTGATSLQSLLELHLQQRGYTITNGSGKDWVRRVAIGEYVVFIGPFAEYLENFARARDVRSVDLANAASVRGIHLSDEAIILQVERR